MINSKLVVFDFDGTLVDSVDIKRDAFYESARKFGIDSELVRASLDAGGDRNNVMSRLSKKINGDAGSLYSVLRNDLISEYNNICENKISECRQTPGLIYCLTKLKKHGIKLYINSATPVEALLSIMKRTNLISYFDDIFGRPFDKVENLKRAMSEVNCSATETVMVGDGIDDAAAAKVVKCRFIAVDCWSKPLFQKNIRPFAYVTKLTELPKLLALE